MATEAGSRRIARDVSVSARNPRPRQELPRLRVLWLMVIVVLLAGAVWGRLAYWQVVEHGSLSAEANAEHLAEVPVAAKRGMIYDRNGQPLAINDTVYDVTLAPDLVAPTARQRVAESLATLLRLPSDHVMALLVSGRKFAYVAKRQPKDVADRLYNLDPPLTGVGLVPEEQRTYLPGGTPDVSLASSLLGFVDYQGNGDRGLEQYYQRQLAGKTGYDSTYRDLQGRELTLGPDKRVPVVDGSGLTLTVDSNVQFAAEQAIADGVRTNKAQSGSVIVIDPSTGGIVAYADYPGYDGNQFTTTDPARTQDPIASGTYEPGSVMKVVTLSGALDDGSITPQTVIDDPGYTDVAGSRIWDWDRANKGNITMTRVLEESYNVGAIKAQQAEGRDSYFHYLQGFGFGQPSGIDVAGEANVKLRQPDQWRESEVATAAFGQGIAVNGVQMAAALNAVVNGGSLVQPHLVGRIGYAAPHLAAPRQVIKPQTAAEMNQMMRSVVQHGSGYTARIPGFELDEGGKTGTAQMPENGRYSTDHVWASYFGFLPAQNPRFTMLVTLNRPNNGSWDHNEGYYCAAPIWKRIAQQIILDWRITPEALPPV
jgi:stage V sporulation protein D (sporulation-specific penicillin-binding protein)